MLKYIYLLKLIDCLFTFIFQKDVDISVLFNMCGEAMNFQWLTNVNCPAWKPKFIFY